MDKQQLLEDQTFEDIEKIIEEAIQKIKGDTDNDLCKYLPMSTGGLYASFYFTKDEAQTARGIRDSD